MPQGPIAVANVNDGQLAALNITVAGVIKVGAGRLARVVIINGGTASNGNFVFNDCATTGAATTANELAVIASGASPGPVTYEIPYKVGLVCSAVPSAGSPQANVVYT